MTGDGVAFSVMVGAGESYLPAFALALGFGDVIAGLVATAPMLAGALLQLATPAVIARVGSNRRCVVTCALIQAASFLPLIWGALLGWLPVGWLFLTAALYWGFGMATGPAWNTWVETIVPKRLRARYFATRARWSQLALVIGLGAAGWLLQAGEKEGLRLEAFAVVFGASMAFRMLSALFLSRQSEPQPIPIGDPRIMLRLLRGGLASRTQVRLLLYLLGFQFAIWVAAPFFTPYMLGPLGLSYEEFAILTATAFVARLAAMPLHGRIAHRWGTRRLLWLGSVGIVPLPALWLVSDDFVWLMLLQMLGGLAWGAFELATLLSFFEHIPSERRTALLSVYNLANAAAIVTGAAIGGYLLDQVGWDRSGYSAILVGSTLLRLLALPLLRGVGDVHPASATAPSMRTITVRPSSGGLQRPVLPGLPEQE